MKPEVVIHFERCKTGLMILPGANKPQQKIFTEGNEGNEGDLNEEWTRFSHTFVTFVTFC